jgi:hypothetical protein
VDNKEIKITDYLNVEVIELSEEVDLLLSCSGCADEDNDYAE